MNGPAAISMLLDGGKFNFRVAGVAVQNEKLLLHKTPSDNFWSLPGGRVDMFEFTRETLLREMLEETGFSVEVGELQWIVENFFEYDYVRYHEIGFYYTMEIRNSQNQLDFNAIEEGSDMLFHWHPIGELSSIKIYPDFISKELIQNSTVPRHILLDFKNLNDG